MTVILGLTGSIGMGKSTTAAMFREQGIPVFDADATVHELYRGEAVQAIERVFPGTATESGIDRKKLGSYVIGQPDKMRILETIIHPMVQKRRQDFIENHRLQKTPLIVLDIPLLFETKSEGLCDKVVVVTAHSDLQRKRVLERGTMSAEQFEAILAKQVPDHDKRLRADHLIETDYGLEQARLQVQSLIELYQKKTGSV
jgi:dephospho-CoA kinase